MSIIRYQPFNAMTQLQQEINRLFGANSPADDDAATLYARNWAPAVDIREEADRYLVFADVPGVNPDDIEITMENGVLTISGERQTESNEHKDGFRRIERARGKFLRRFTLPAECRWR